MNNRLNNSGRYIFSRHDLVEQLSIAVIAGTFLFAAKEVGLHQVHGALSMPVGFFVGLRLHEALSYRARSGILFQPM